MKIFTLFLLVFSLWPPTLAFSRLSKFRFSVIDQKNSFIADEDKIPFELERGRIYVQAYVNEKGPFRFMVDTGASGIGRADVRLVEEVGLPITGTTTNSDGINTATVNQVGIKSLRIGQLAKNGIEVMSRDYNRNLLSGGQIEYGIIGREFFADYLLTIDYEHKELIVGKDSLKATDPHNLPYSAGEIFRVPLRLGQYDAAGYLDTGSNLEIHLPMEWSQKLSIQNLKPAGEARRANTVFKLFAAELPVTVNIGGNSIVDTQAHFSELAKHINIGSAFFSKNKCVIKIDQKNRLVGMRCKSRNLSDKSVSGSKPSETLVNGRTGNEIDAILTKLSQDGYSGSVLIAKDGSVILQKGYGLADRERNLNNTPDTLFSIASVSKTFTAAAILQLAEKGRLRTSDPISKYLGVFPGEKNQATIHHLLTHTSGLVVGGSTLDESSRKAFIKSMKEAPMESTPGEKYRYSNAGYSLLAAIVEEVSGMSFEEYVDKNIFKPAGMNLTGYVWDKRFDNSPMAVGYSGNNPENLRPEPRQTNIWAQRGPTGVLTTVGDLYKWIKALENNRVLSAASKNKMFTAYFGDEGYGWHVNKTAGGGMLVNRGGGLPEFESELRWYVDDNIVVIFTINNHLGFRRKILEGIEKVISSPN